MDLPSVVVLSVERFKTCDVRRLHRVDSLLEVSTDEHRK